MTLALLKYKKYTWLFSKNNLHQWLFIPFFYPRPVCLTAGSTFPLEALGGSKPTCPQTNSGSPPGLAPFQSQPACRVAPSSLLFSSQKPRSHPWQLIPPVSLLSTSPTHQWPNPHCFLLRSLSNLPTLLHSNHQGSTQGQVLLKGYLLGNHLWPDLQEYLSLHRLPFLVFPGHFPTRS